jgi:hypothetical protein
MTPPVLFLDIDGVLNVPGDYAPGCALIRPVLAARLQRVLDATAAVVVVSSAWRYQVLMGAVTLRGFEHLLRSHGIRARVLDTTGRDAGDDREDFNGATAGDERARQIRRWLASPPAVTRWAVVDDSLVDVGPRLVRTDGARGLEDGHADRLIVLLREGVAA